MFESRQKLRHLPFFEEIANRVEGDPEWHAATAGLVVLRLVERCLEEGAPLSRHEDGWAVRSVRAAIEEMSAGTPIRTILGRVLFAVEERRPNIHVLLTPLMGYGQALEYEAKWSLAVDVYDTVLQHLHPMEDADAVIAAHLRLGSCYRSVNRIQEATRAYAAVSAIATAVGDMEGILRARVGESAIAVLTGNLPYAQEILDETIAQAQGERLRDVRSRALHERAEVAKLRGDYEVSIRFAHRALHDSQSQIERDRILGDMAGAFAEIGMYSVARDAYLVLSVTAQEQYTRWGATLNLLEISAQTGALLFFEQYLDELVNQPLPPYLRTGFHLIVGTGYQRFGYYESARSHLEHALAMASEYALNQMVFDAEEALRGTKTPAPPRATPAVVPLDVQEVASEIRSLRESVSAG